MCTHILVTLTSWTTTGAMSRKLLVAMGTVAVLLLLSLVAVTVLAVLYRNTQKTQTDEQAAVPQPEVKFTVGEAVCKVTSADVTEASGLCSSRRHKDVLYTHNDSGDGPRVFAFNRTDCGLLSTINIQGASNVDYEDIACGSCGEGSDDVCVYIADIGSNAIYRPYNTIYRIREPDSLKQEDTVVANGTLRFRWDEYDGETLMIGPDATLYVVSKSADGNGRMYKLPASWDNDDVITLDWRDGIGLQLGTAEKNPVGGDIAADGKEVLIKAQGAVFYFHVPDMNYALHMRTRPLQLPYLRERQGESVAWGTGTEDYFTLSEGSNSTLYIYRQI